MSFLTGSSGQSELDKVALLNLKIKIPKDLPSQQKLTLILSTLDAKIENNNRINAELEAMAHTLFKSWFLDFDPVKVKTEGRKIFGMSDEVASLFPNEFVPSEIGMIPRGWKLGTVADFYHINPRRQLYKESEVPYLDMMNISTKGCMPIADIHPRIFKGGSKFMNGDTLIARITPCLENGKTAFVTFLNNCEIGCGSTEFIVLRPREQLPPVVGYLLARSESFREFAIQSMIGSSGRKRVDMAVLHRYPFVCPPNSVCSEFSKMVNPFFDKIHSNWKENQELVKLRDWLLPMLMNGQITVV